MIICRNILFLYLLKTKDMKYLLSGILIFSTILFSCKKDETVEPNNDNNGGNGQTTAPVDDIELSKLNFYVFEVAHASLNNGLNPDSSSYQGFINGVSTHIEVKDGSIYFFIPDVPSGNYNLTVNIDGDSYSTKNFNVTKLAITPNPSSYVSNLTSDVNVKIQELREITDSLSNHINSSIAHQDINNLENHFNQLIVDFNNLSPADQQIAVDVCNANIQGILDFELAVNALVFQYPPYMKSTYNYLDDVDNRTTSVKNAVKEAIKANKYYIGTTAVAGAIIGGVPTAGLGAGPGAAIGAGLATAYVVLLDDKVHKAVEQRVKDICEPITSFFSSIFKPSNLQFSDGQPLTMQATGDFNSLYSGNATTNSFRSELTNSIIDFSNSWENIKANVPWNISSSVTNPNNISSPTLYNGVPIHAQYFTVSTITNNSSVQLVNYQNINGELVVEYTTQSTTPENFDMIVEYSSFMGTLTEVIPTTISDGALNWTANGRPAHNMVLPTSCNPQSNDGSISMYWSGGQPPYQVSKDGGQTWQTPTNPAQLPSNVSHHTYSNLPCITYTITVKDALNNQINDIAVLVVQ